jgi:hypothetical protein
MFLIKNTHYLSLLSRYFAESTARIKWLISYRACLEINNHVSRGNLFSKLNSIMFIWIAIIYNFARSGVSVLNLYRAQTFGRITH